MMMPRRGEPTPALTIVALVSLVAVMVLPAMLLLYITTRPIGTLDIGTGREEHHAYQPANH